MQSGESIGPYRIVARLGAGAMGEVFRVEGPGKAALAVKRLKLGTLEPQVRLRFQREAELAARLNNPHIARVHGADFSGSDPYVVQELLEGGSLKDRLARGPLALEEAVRITGQLAEAVTHAHAAGVLHRDIKPDNVLFDEQGRAKLADFGLGRALGSDDRLTATGVFMGSPGYMAPEALNAKEAGPPADLYGLGAVFYAMVAGRPPGRIASSLAGTLHALQYEDPAPPSSLQPGLPAWVDEVCARALARDPKARFPTPAALVESMQARSAVAKSWKGWALGGVALALTVGALSAAATRPGSRPRSPAASPSPSSPATPAPPLQSRLEEIEVLSDPLRRIDALEEWLRAERDQAERRRGLELHRAWRREPIARLEHPGTGRLKVGFVGPELLLAWAPDGRTQAWSWPSLTPCAVPPWFEPGIFKTSVNIQGLRPGLPVEFELLRHDGDGKTLEVEAIAFDRQDAWVARGEHAGRVSLISLDGRRVREVCDRRVRVRALCFSLDGRRLWISSGEPMGDFRETHPSTLALYELGEEPTLIHEEILGGVARELDLSPRGDVLALGTELGEVSIFSTQSGLLLQRTHDSLVDATVVLPTNIRDLAWGPNAEVIHAVGTNKPPITSKLLTWWLETGDQVTSTTRPDDLNSLACGPAGRLVLATGPQRGVGIRAVEVWAAPWQEP